MTMIINTKNQRLSVVDRLEYREVSHKLDKTRAGVLTNRPERANEYIKLSKNKKHLSNYPKSIFSEKQKGVKMVSTEQLARAVQELSKHLPPITEEDTVLVDMNKSLNIIQKFFIKRRLRRIISEQSNHS